MNPIADTQPVRDRQTLVQSRDSLEYAIENLNKLIDFLKAILTTLRGDSPETCRSNPAKDGTLVGDFDNLTQTLHDRLLELRNNLESLDFFLGTGYTPAMKNEEIAAKATHLR